MKKRLWQGLLATVILLSSGLIGQQVQASTIQKGTLTIGLEGTYAPFSYREKGKLVGYEVDVANKVAKKLKLKPKFAQTKWDSLIAGLGSKRYDVVFNNVGITDERKAHYLFSTPYLYSKTVLIQRKDGQMKHLSDIKDKKFAQSTTSNFGQMAKDNGAKIVAVPGMVEAMSLIESGRADGELNDKGAYAIWKKENPKTKVKAVELSTAEAPDVPAAPLLNKNNVKLQKQINRALKSLKEDGTLKKLSIKYFKTDLTKK
ncbi:transporter substrate-binding domain-containing protein [Weissella diestrammenae]|uniref:Transporter substrate-binding domain-containing protein n=1 Tax=Weissella diestrammenae TaxID=1162633 RepID=A0A7G9T5E2_9LACO|nr:transporter substrate-binding domain-containing protein [Weissella diestrammenae]MCM0583175.1 transporter substrate-binding domain-containing protein [Weissella diestrammenae]QNN75317.1 transporter substrate-binding domain-containing protein [Weissella diestrammenae]